jgi:hypothetical protein
MRLLVKAITASFLSVIEQSPFSQFNDLIHFIECLLSCNLFHADDVLQVKKHKIVET